MNTVHGGSGWADELNRLVLHGRDREAVELASRHLRDERTGLSTERQGSVTMGPHEQLDELGPLLGGVAAGITAADLEAPTPCDDFTVRGVLGHMITGAAQFSAAFRGETPADVPADVADGADVVARAGAALGDLIAAIQAPGALDRTVAAPFGEVPGETFARFVVLDGLVHGWDIAVATGQSYAPSDALVDEVDSFAHQAITPAMRQAEMFADPVEPSSGATPIERLAAFTGRTT